jgi:large subunit ribosomal protein L30
MSQSGQNGSVLRITLIRSTIGRPADQGRTVESLGLRRLHSTVERPDTPSIRGMVNKIQHLVRVEEAPADAPGQMKSSRRTDKTPRRDA